MKECANKHSFAHLTGFTVKDCDGEKERMIAM